MNNVRAKLHKLMKALALQVSLPLASNETDLNINIIVILGLEGLLLETGQTGLCF